MRLIDADEIIIDETCTYSGTGVKVLLDNTPTAYDVEKVRKAIEDLDRHMDNGDFATCHDMLVVLKDVLKIIESGGVKGEMS